MLNKKNLIIGIATNYNRYDINVFVESLRKTGYVEDIVIFETNFSPKCYKYCKENDVTTININSNYPWFKEERYLKELRKLDPSVQFPAHFIRFFLIDAYLKCHEEFSNVIISDVRDVFFKKNTFNEPLGQEHINAAWVRNGYTEAGLKEIQNDFISCCGVVIGDSKAMTRYVRIMCDEFERLANTMVKIGFDGVMEQASHNYLLRKGKFDPVSIISDDDGIVSTLSYFKPISYIHINKSNQITNFSGRIIPIIHQYDRFPNIDRKLQCKLSLKSNIYYVVSKKAKWLIPVLNLIF